MNLKANHISGTKLKICNTLLLRKLMKYCEKLQSSNVVLKQMCNLFLVACNITGICVTLKESESL